MNKYFLLFFFLLAFKASFAQVNLLSLDQLDKRIEQGKDTVYVVNFWATWCAPCRETSPVFEYQAKKNKFNDEIVFLSISIDQDKNKWKLDLKNKQSNVKQWWISNPKMLGELGVNSIPRFMLIDKNGKIYNSNMPPPTETNFEDILEKIGDKNFSYTSQAF